MFSIQIQPNKIPVKPSKTRSRLNLTGKKSVKCGENPWTDCVSQHFLFPTVSCGANSFMEGPKSTLLWRLLLPLYLFVYLFIFSFDASSTFFRSTCFLLFFLSFFFFLYFASVSCTASCTFFIFFDFFLLFRFLTFWNLSPGTRPFLPRTMDGWMDGSTRSRKRNALDVFLYSLVPYRRRFSSFFWGFPFFFNIFFIFSPPRRSHRSEIPPELFPVAGFFSIFCILFSTL